MICTELYICKFRTGQLYKKTCYNKALTLFTPYFVYVLRTSANTLYIGQTNNLEKRLKEHQNKTSKSAKYIRYFASFKLVYSETHPSRAEAMKRERQLKKLTKTEKEKLIKI